MAILIRNFPPVLRLMKASRQKSVFRNMTHLILESHYNRDVPHAVKENNTKADMQMFTQFPWRWIRLSSVKPRSDCEVESPAPTPEQKVCQGRIHQKYGKPYLYESGSDIKLDTFEGDDESLLPRKDMLLRNILQTMEAGRERQELKPTWWFLELFLS